MIRPVKTIRKLQESIPVTIVALGDSLTQGWMVRRGYVDFFEEMLRGRFPESTFSLINRGIPGDTAEGGLYRVEHDVLRNKPDCVLVQFGLNDAFSGCSPEQFESCIQEIVERIKKGPEAETVLLTSSYIGPNRENRIVEQYYKKLEAIAMTNRLAIALVHAYWKKRIDEEIEFRRLVQSDCVHPTEEGYRLMAEALIELFEVPQNENP